MPWKGDDRTWNYYHETKPRFLSQLANDNSPHWETIGATAGGEAAWVDPGNGYGPQTLTWNAQGKLHRYKDSAYSYDVFGETTLVVTGPSGATTSIVSVGEDFEYDTIAYRANKFFSVDGVRIASLGTSYVACDSPCPASVPPALRIVIRYAEPLAAPAAAVVLVVGLFGLASLTLRRRTPVWLSVPGVGVLSFVLVALPYTAHAATLTNGAGRYGRHGEPILAYLVDHLGTMRAAVNQDGIVLETRDYAPFGESIAHVGAFSVQHRFTGQPQDDQEGGLYNYGARFYNPKWGRFVSPDEMVQGFDSQGLNPFTYVLNQPTSATDPTGNQGEGVGSVSGGFSGGGFGGGLGQMGSIGSGFGGCASLWSLATGGAGSKRDGARRDFAEGEWDRMGSEFSNFQPLLGGPSVLVDMPGTGDGGAADRGQAVQDGIARNAQIRATKKAIDELKKIRQKYTGQPVDAYGQVVIKADRRPSITELGREVETPISTRVTPIVVSPGTAPPPAMVPADTPSTIYHVRNVLVIRNGRPVEIR